MDNTGQPRTIVASAPAAVVVTAAPSALFAVAAVNGDCKVLALTSQGAVASGTTVANYQWLLAPQTGATVTTQGLDKRNTTTTLVACGNVQITHSVTDSLGRTTSTTRTVDTGALAPAVTGINPTTATFGVPVSFSVTGSNLPLTARITVVDANCQEPTGNTASGFAQVCTPSGAVGAKLITVFTGPGGSVIDASRSVNVVGAPSPTTIASVACTNPAAGVVMACTVTGSGLPASGMTMSASNCSPATMPQQIGGTSNSRTFACTPTLFGNLTITGVTVPGYTGVLPRLPSYFTVSTAADAVKLMYVADNVTAALVAVNPVTLVSYPVGNTGVAMTDIAYSPSGELFGVTGTSLYRINPGTAASSLVGGGYTYMVGLAFSPDGVLYGIDGSRLFTIDVGTGRATLVGDTGFTSAGDIEFDAVGVLYGSTTQNTLIRIDRATGASVTVGNLGYANTFGLSLGSNNVLYGFSGINAFTINTSSGTGTPSFYFNSTSGVTSVGGASTRP